MTTPTLVYRGREFPITEAMVLGRHRDCDLQVNDGAASRQHARLVPDAGSVRLEDLGSANGVKLNGKRLQAPSVLKHGDRITIGESHLVFQAGAETEFVEPSAKPEKVSGHARTDRPEALLGQRLGGFRLSSVIGSGTVGTVYIARQLNLDRDVALKVFDTSLVDVAFAERLTEQAKRAASLRHDGLAAIHEWGREGDLLWYAMELVAGDTLQHLIERDGRIAPEMALLIIDRVLDGLAEAHSRNVVHGDIKPANIMITREGDVKLLELGIAQVLMEGQQSVEGAAVVGTPAYMSPEQARCEPLDPRSDIYNLGCALYHALVGRPPFAGATPLAVIKAHADEPIPHPSKTVSGLPASLDHLVDGMLAKNRDWRFATAAEVDEAVAAARNDLKVAAASAARAPSPGAANRTPGSRVNASAARPPRSAGRRQRQRSTAGIQAMAGLIVVVLLVVGWLVLGPKLMRQDSPSTGGSTTASSGSPIQRPGIGPAGGTTRPTTRPTDPVVADTVSDRWDAAQTRVDQLTADDRWGEAELVLNDFRRSTSNPAYVSQADVALASLRTSAGTWYARRIDTLRPGRNLPEHVMVAALDELRNQVHNDRRSDVESRYREAVRRLKWRATEASEAASAAIREGRAADVPALAATLQSEMDGTIMAGPAATFAARATEAARWPWQGSWAATRAELDNATGEMALAAGATLFLIGDPEPAVMLLLADASLEGGALQRRRDALLAGESLVLDFSHPADLQQLERRFGEASVRNDQVTGPAGEPVGLGVAQTIGGDAWQVEMQLSLAPVEGEVVQAVIGFGRNIAVVVDGQGASVRHGEDEPRAIERSGADLHLRVTTRAGRTLVVVNGALVADLPAASVPSGSRLGLDIAGMQWALDDLTVVGGRS